jgi:hypothetical protein
MAITNQDIVALASAFHDASMVKKSTAAEMAEFFDSGRPDQHLHVLAEVFHLNDQLEIGND